MKWSAIICGIVGGGIPFLLGAYLAGHEMVYRALHPTPPGMGACGMPMAVALFVIAVGTPRGAGAFALVGWLLGGCVALCKNKRLEPPGEVVAAAAVEHRMDDNPYRSPQTRGLRKMRQPRYGLIAVLLIVLAIALALLLPALQVGKESGPRHLPREPYTD